MSEVAVDRLDTAIYSVLDGVNNIVTQMSTIASMVYTFDERFDWVGFYRNRGDKVLEIGPYQGGLGCLHIPFGKGVCGHVAQTEEAIIVPDVDSFAGHIACSSTTKSELVLPVRNKSGELIAVFDLDSNQPDAFRADDLSLLQNILDTVFADAVLEPFYETN